MNNSPTLRTGPYFVATVGRNGVLLLLLLLYIIIIYYGDVFFYVNDAYKYLKRRDCSSIDGVYVRKRFDGCNSFDIRIFNDVFRFRSLR